MKYGSVCTGIGGFDLALDAAGFECAWQIEIDEKCREVLQRHWPNVPRKNDMRKEGKATLEKVDVLAGGTPCQAFSLAGLRNSLNDDRGNLTLEFVRLADELEPKLLIWENVPGCLSVHDNAFGCFLAALVGADAPLIPPDAVKGWKTNSKGKRCFSWPNAGMVAGSKRTAAWRILDAQYFGVAQRRERVFLVASPGNASRLDEETSRTLGSGFSSIPSEILFEPKMLRGNSPPGRKARQEVAGTLGGGSGSRGWCSDTDRTTFIAFGGGRNGELEVATTLNAHPTGRRDFESDTFVAHTLTSRHDSSEDSSGRGLPQVVDCCAAIQERAVCENPDAGPDGLGVRTDGLAYTLEARSVPQAVAYRTANTGANGAGVQSEVAFTLDGACGQAIAYQQDTVAFDTSQITSKANRSNPQPGDPCHPLCAMGHPPTVVYRTNASGQVDSQGDIAAAVTQATDPSYQFLTHWTAAGVGGGDVGFTLRSNASHSGDKGDGGVNTTLAFTERGREGGRNLETSDLAYCLTSPSDGGRTQSRMVLHNMAVRRLTPTETCRLQGFPDDWNNLGADLEAKTIQMSDSARYKQCGNAVAEPCVEWIARRAAAVLKSESSGSENQGIQ